MFELLEDILASACKQRPFGHLKSKLRYSWLILIW
jgi:hypothetical protein